MKTLKNRSKLILVLVTIMLFTTESSILFGQVNTKPQFKELGVTSNQQGDLKTAKTAKQLTASPNTQSTTYPLTLNIAADGFYEGMRVNVTVRYIPNNTIMLKRSINILKKDNQLYFTDGEKQTVILDNIIITGLIDNTFAINNLGIYIEMYNSQGKIIDAYSKNLSIQ